MKNSDSSVTASYLLANVAPAVILTINVISNQCENSERADDASGKNSNKTVEYLAEEKRGW